MKPINHFLLRMLTICALLGFAVLSGRAQNGKARPAALHLQTNTSVPLGGIGTGSFMLRADGTVSEAALANNGQPRSSQADGCFAAVWAQVDGRSTARVLALHSAYRLPTAARMDYDGLYPQARLAFSDAALPVSVSLLAFSPLVPFDLKNSSFPAAAFVLRLKNPSRAPADVSVALSWESLLPHGGEGRGRASIVPSGGGFFGARFTNGAANGEMIVQAYPQQAQAAVSAALWDAGSAEPDWWAAFAHDGTVPNAPPDMVLNAARPAALVSVRLALKPGESVELPFAVSWYFKQQTTPNGADAGRFYEVAFADAQDVARQLLEDWRSLYGLTEEWQKRLTFSNLPVWLMRRIINAAAPLTTNTIHTRDGRFAFLASGENPAFGSADAPANATTVNPNANANIQADIETNLKNNRNAESLMRLSVWEMERQETLAHQSADALLLALFPQLAAQEIGQFADSQTSQGFVVAPASGDWRRRIGLPRQSASPLIPRADTLFSTFASGQKGNAADQSKSATKSRSPGKANLPKSSNTPDANSPHADNPSRRDELPTFPPLPAHDPLDATSAYVLQTAQFALWTGDTDFLNAHYVSLRLACRALLSLRDREGLPIVRQEEKEKRRKGEKEKTAERSQKSEDPPPNTQRLIPNTQHPTPALLTQWLAALRAGQRMAVMTGDAAFAKECEAAIEQAGGRVDAHYWNGEFYAAAPLPDMSANRKPTVRPEDVCATDQLWGQWLAYQLDLGALLPPEHLKRATQSLKQRNDSAAAAIAAFGPPWQMRADGAFPDEPCARACLLPASTLSDAILSIWQDQPEAGVALLQRLDAAQEPAQGERKKERQEQRSPSPTLFPLAAAADWNALYALQGFALDLNEGRMTLAPNIPGMWRSFTTPVFTPTFWGRIEYRPTAHGGITTFRLDRLIGFIAMPGAQALRNRAELTLKSLRILGPPRRDDNSLPAAFTTHVSVGTKPLGCRTSLDSSGFVTLTFDSPLVLTAGDRLEVDMH